MNEFRVSTDLGRLSVREVGDGRPVILWHSMFVDSHSWDRIVPDLAADHRLFLVDAPSTGGSDALERAVDIAACARAAERLVDDIRRRTGHDRVRWVGNAWGGHVGLDLAATRPDMIADLVAISAPTHPIDRGVRRKVRALLPLYRIIGARGPVLSAIEDTLFTERTRREDAEAMDMLHDSLSASGRSMIAAVETAILNRTDLGWAAARITAPVAFVTTDDRGEWTPEEARAVAVTMDDAVEITVSGARVIPALERPAATADAIRSFWAEVDRRPPARRPEREPEPSPTVS